MTKIAHIDQQLLDRIQQHDQQAFRQLFDRYYESLLRSVLHITGDVNLAKDVAQEVFLELWKKREKLLIKTSLKAYLHRAMINRTFNQLKARKHQYQEPAQLPENPIPAHADLNLEASDLQQIIQQTIDALPEKCRIVFTLCRLEGLSHKAIAEQLGISPKTVENQMTKALRILRDAVKPYLSEGMLLFLYLLGGG
ncbi:MAG: RNA polymerase sigma-70 factor [Bacteroidota bacterium]